MSNNISDWAIKLRKKSIETSRAASSVAGQLSRKSFWKWPSEGLMISDDEFSKTEDYIDKFRYLSEGMERISTNYKTIPIVMRRVENNPTDGYIVGMFDRAYECRRIINNSKEKFSNRMYEMEFRPLELLAELDEMEEGFPEAILNYFGKTYDILPEYRREEMGLI